MLDDSSRVPVPRTAPLRQLVRDLLDDLPATGASREHERFGERRLDDACELERGRLRRVRGQRGRGQNASAARRFVPALGQFTGLVSPNESPIFL